MMKRSFYWLLSVAALLLLLTVCAANLRYPGVFFRLQGTWARQVDDLTDTRLELQVRGRKIEYRFVSRRFPELNDTLHVYRWEFLDADTLRVHYDETHFVDTDLSVEGRTLTFTPAITQEEDEGVWYKK